MISDHRAFVSLQSPAAWSRPPFQLGERVYAKTTDNPGTIVGVMFCQRPIESIGEIVTDQGWWFEIELDETATFHHVCPREILFWNVIQPFRVSSQPSYVLEMAV